MTTKEVTLKIPPALRLLQEEYTTLTREEINLSSQISHLGRELRKQKRTVRDLERTIDRLKEAYHGLVRAKIASLKEFVQLRSLLVVNIDLLERISKEAAKTEKSGLSLAEKLEIVQKAKQIATEELKSWNKILKFEAR